MSALPSPLASQAKRWLIAIAGVAYILAAALGTVYGSAALYQLFHKQAPHDIEFTTTYAYWLGTEGDVRERKKLMLAIGLPAGLLFMVIPIALASMGPQRRDLHGSARFAREDEIRKAGLFPERGIILGKYRGRFLMLAGAQSVILSAPTRSGKGVGVVIPNLLGWKDSVVVLDIKGENYKKTAGFRAAHGQTVYRWAPFDETSQTHRYNPLAYVREEWRFTVGDILSVAQSLYVSDRSKGSNDTAIYFNDEARNLFLGLALYLVETPELPRTIGEVLRQASGQGQGIREHISALMADRDEARPLRPECIEALSRFVSRPENTLGGIVGTLTAPLTLFSDPLVDIATSGNDFSFHDLRRKRMSVYVEVPPKRLDDASVLISLFWSQLVKINTDQLPEENPELKHQCLLILDEFTAPGRMPIFAKGIGYMAGYGLRCLTVIQSRAQLASAYGKEDARTYSTNHAAQIFYAPGEQADANEYSEMLGTYTAASESKGRSTSGKGGSSRSTNTSPQRRPLLLPQEFKELGTDREVILVENVKPIYAEKIRYHDDPVLKDRVMSAPVSPQQDADAYRRALHATRGARMTTAPIEPDYAQLPELTAAADHGALSKWTSKFYELFDFVTPDDVDLAPTVS